MGARVVRVCSCRGVCMLSHAGSVWGVVMSCRRAGLRCRADVMVCCRAIVLDMPSCCRATVPSCRRAVSCRCAGVLRCCRVIVLCHVAGLWGFCASCCVMLCHAVVCRRAIVLCRDASGCCAVVPSCRRDGSRCRAVVLLCRCALVLCRAVSCCTPCCVVQCCAAWRLGRWAVVMGRAAVPIMRQWHDAVVIGGTVMLCAAVPVLL